MHANITHSKLLRYTHVNAHPQPTHVHTHTHTHTHTNTHTNTHTHTHTQGSSLPHLLIHSEVESLSEDPFAAVDTPNDVAGTNKKLCTVCMDNERSCRLRPCMHAALCTQCAQSLMSRKYGCPICDTRIDSLERGQFMCTFTADTAQVFARVCVLFCTALCKDKHTCTHACAHSHTCTHTHMHMHIHTHAHAHTHTYTHKHTGPGEDN